MHKCHKDRSIVERQLHSNSDCEQVIVGAGQTFLPHDSYASAVLRVVILSVHPSVRPSVYLSVTRVLCD